VVLQIAPYARQMLTRYDSVRAEMISVSNSGQHQEMRRPKGTATQNYFTLGFRPDTLSFT
jgi:hypothetical protein